MFAFVTTGFDGPSDVPWDELLFGGVGGQDPIENNNKKLP